ncbi:hypothetical protein COOONC_04134 [Cooperia oncophora]
MFSEEASKNKDMMARLNQTGGKFTVTVIRFKRRPTIKPILPKGYEPVQGFEYEWTVLYLMRGMVLGLDVRMIDKKIYVANLMPDSIAAMSLLIGECIIDVDGELVTSIPQAAVGPSAEVKDLPLPPETKPWCEKGIAALKEKDPKPVYREPKADKSVSMYKSFILNHRTQNVQAKRDATVKGQRRVHASRHFNEKTVQHDYYEDLQTSLIVKVPPPRTSSSDSPAM